MQIESLYQLYKSHPVISTDTRNITPDSLFFALKGEKFNGNAFAAQALEHGAKYAIIDEIEFKLDDRFILVEDVLSCLQDLATYHRQQLTIPVIGITGTNGKTTTKELIHAVLSQQFVTYATKGNLNNHIGVPLTLLSIDGRVEIAVIEMGANHIGEIETLCRIAQPNYGLITNVGKAHLEGFGSFEGVKKTKGELYDYLSEHDGTLFLQADNAYLQTMFSQRTFSKVYRYGFSDGLDLNLTGSLVSADPLLTIEWKGEQSHTIKVNLTGSYNTENVLAAIAIGLELGVSEEKINLGIQSYVPRNNRSQIMNTDRNIIIADFYNANASSMAAALDNMAAITGKHKALILGDMFEMGDESFVEHQVVIAKAKATQVDLRIFIGKAFYDQRSNEDYYFETIEKAKDFLLKRALANYTILVKGSRGMAFENLIEVL